MCSVLSIGQGMFELVEAFYSCSLASIGHAAMASRVDLAEGLVSEVPLLVNKAVQLWRSDFLFCCCVAAPPIRKHQELLLLFPGGEGWVLSY